MAEETKIGMKLEKEVEPIKKMCETLEDSIKHEFSKGIENIDTMEMKEAIDMLKDLYEAKEKLVKSCYYKSVIEAMEEHDFDDEEDIMDYGRRGYRGQPRDSRGRYMSRKGRRMGYEEPPYYHMTPEMYKEHDPEYWRDMDRETMGRMYYDGGSMDGNYTSVGSSQGGMSGSSSSVGNRGMMRDAREGRAGVKRKGYMEAKEMGKEKGEKMKNLEEYMKDLSMDVTEMLTDMSPEEKALMKQKMQVLMQKL